ncbi:Hypothetical protein R9X50_00142800 [Acrodontium crateriforme]|uniref:Uncharacterized protein n=1 Tax=Acrodontium crateriforme TaxID=150365 RepID=A0AAQ3R7W2_9PEZI|nr:Hypothetical protein R9X50_00142800 [Acrodontium crateriforme]
MVKQKQFVKPAKKSKAPVAPQTADEFQEAADFEEDTGGKWRAGDPAKSSRAFVRALDIYDKGLEKHANNFDLAYNKARLQFELTQQPALVAHIGLPLTDLLQQTLMSHRYALKLNDDNPDVLFNTSQVLTTLAEEFSDHGEAEIAVPLLHEALELLSSCLSRQEMLLEQHQADFGDVEGAEDGGGVPLEPDERPASTSEEMEEQVATIETPITPNDLIDTINASLSALSILVALVDQPELQTLGDMAHSLTESKLPAYLDLLPSEEQEAPRLAIGLERAIFVAAFADAQFNFAMIDLETYVSRLSAFDGIINENDESSLCSAAEARVELVLSTVSQLAGSPDLPVDICWKQLSTAQDLYSKASKIESTAQLNLSRADLEMLRHRIATVPNLKIAENIRKNGPILAQNAQTYYKVAARLAAGDDSALKEKAQLRFYLVGYMRNGLYETELTADAAAQPRQGLQDALMECVEESLIDPALADEMATHLAGQK